MSDDMGRGRPVVVVTTISASLRLTTALMVVAQASPRRAVTRIGVPGSWSLSGRAATDSVARVVAAQFHGDGPLQHGGNLLPDRLGGRRLRVPDGGQDRQHVSAGDLGHGPRADAREGVAGQAVPPVPGFAGVPPAGRRMARQPFSPLRAAMSWNAASIAWRWVSSRGCTQISEEP